MKNKFNNLLRYIYDYSDKTQRKETVNGLFRAILEPLIQNQKVEACIFCRIIELNDKESVLKRLLFSGAEIYNFSDISLGVGFENCEKDDIWGKTEFLVVLGGRYSAALIWDYSDSEVKDTTKVCLLYNSKIILEIAKLISENSKQDLKELLKKYVPDRRENVVLNKSIQTIVSILNDKNEECMFSQKEKNSLEKDEDTFQTAKTVTDKAKFIAHEIKNHLSIINLYSKIANKRFETITERNETFQSIENALKNITNASENISYLVSDLRCISAPYKSEISFKTLVGEAVELCGIRAENEGVNIQNNVNTDNSIITDKVKVQCAITNIIFNAIDANAKNIIVDVKDRNILIKNDGDEIPEAIQSRIFEENFTTKEKGNGLGLAFCKKQLNLANGDIELVSSMKTETVFKITI